MTISLQVCGCIETKKLDKVLLFNILIEIASIESLSLFRFLIMVTFLLFTEIFDIEYLQDHAAIGCYAPDSLDP